MEGCGIREVRTAYRSAWQNPFVERFIGMLRRELLDHVIVLSQRHPERFLREFIDDYYHVARPHQGLNGDTPMPLSLGAPFPQGTDLSCCRHRVDGPQIAIDSTVSHHRGLLNAGRTHRWMELIGGTPISRA